MRRKKNPAIIAADIETDPFDGRTIVKPFCLGVYNGSSFTYNWSEDCVKWFIRSLSYMPDGTIVYFHNGGKFDFFFMLEYLISDLLIVNGRILSARVGEIELRDSWGIFPEPLRNHDKGEIDFDKMRIERRERHRKEILEYLTRDCVSLYKICETFHNEFSNRLTVGGTSLGKLREVHPFVNASDPTEDDLGYSRVQIKREAVNRAALFDREIRPFYYGGRNQCFKTGIIEGDYKIYDVNNMYSYCMKFFKHPISTEFPTYVNDIDHPGLAFAKIDALSYGALPVRTKTGLDFPHGRFTFLATIHEIKAGLETGTLKIERFHYGLAFRQFVSFADFVDTYHRKRLASRLLAKDAETKEERQHHELMVSFFKRVLNSAYGRFAINPENFSDWKITPLSEVLGPPWELDAETFTYRLWRAPVALEKKEYVNVATSASITGAARSVLLRGITSSVDPLYCDTDSILCRNLRGDFDPSQLGAWKLEASGNLAAIGGKKLYALFSASHRSDIYSPQSYSIPGKDARETLSLIKKAHKGSKISEQDILNIAGSDAVIRWRSLAPAFKLDGNHVFVHRDIRKTGKPGRVPEPIV